MGVNISLIVSGIMKLEYNLSLSNWFFIGYWILKAGRISIQPFFIL